MKAPKAIKGEDGQANGSSRSRKEYGDRTTLGEFTKNPCQGDLTFQADYPRL